MTDGKKRPGFEEALQEFRVLPFQYGKGTKTFEATVAICALYDRFVNEDRKEKANTTSALYSSPAASVTTFVHNTEELLDVMQKNPSALNINKMDVMNQAEAKDRARLLIEVLREKIQQDFPKEYDHAIASLTTEQRARYGR